MKGDEMTETTIDQRWYRTVMGQYPTGVCVVTATQKDGTEAGFVIGTFSSVSMEPPLIGFFPTKTSTSWPKIEAAGRFCVNILSADQEPLCRQFSAKGGDKFAGVATRRSKLGSPILDGAVAWIDCELESVGEAGDHHFVLGRVHDMNIESETLPLLFFQGGFGRFAPHSLIAAYTPSGVTREQLRSVDLVRPAMESLSRDLGARCIATTVENDNLVVLASAGSPEAQSRATLVGARLPFTPPNGSAIAAWYPEDRIDKWLSTAAQAETRDENLRQLERIRDRGYSVGLLNDAQRQFAAALVQIAQNPKSMESEDLRPLMKDLLYDPEEFTTESAEAIRVIAVPVFNADGEVELALTVYGFAKPDGDDGIWAFVDRAKQAGLEATAALGGRVPSPARAAV